MRIPHTVLPLSLLLGCITGNGESAAEVREVGSFETISVPAHVPVEFEISETQHVEVVCDSNLIEFIKTDVRGKNLTVDVHNRRIINPTADCFVAVSAPVLTRFGLSGAGDLFAQGPLADLEEIQVSGSGRVFAQDVASARLRVQTSGSGGVTVEGIADAIDIRTSGSGGVEARDLLAEAADVRITGSGSSTVTVSGTLEADLSGSGELHVYGDPAQVLQEVSGSGDVHLH